MSWSYRGVGADISQVYSGLFLEHLGDVFVVEVSEASILPAAAEAMLVFLNKLRAEIGMGYSNQILGTVLKCAPFEAGKACF